MSKPLIVQKYGGSSLAEPAQIRDVAARVARLRADGYDTIVVVSAMGKTTDQLVELAYRVSAAPNRRELDMLLTTGERVSMALMSMALNDAGCPAASLTGSQAGVLTDGAHSNARVREVRPARIESLLQEGRCAVIAGFQGVSPDTKEITTLGRGGSDVTAVALAARFGAVRCDILKDVDGVYSADPREIPDARHIAELTIEALLDMTYWGAKVLHYRSVELACATGVELAVEFAHPPEQAHAKRRTRVRAKKGAADVYEQTRLLSINSHRDVRWLRARASSSSEALAKLGSALNKKSLPWPQLLDGEPVDGGNWRFLIAGPIETLNAMKTLALGDVDFAIEPGDWSAVAATCQGAYASDLPLQFAQALDGAGVVAHKMIFGAMSLAAVVEAKDRVAAERALHGLVSP